MFNMTFDQIRINRIIENSQDYGSHNRLKNSPKTASSREMAAESKVFFESCALCAPLDSQRFFRYAIILSTYKGHVKWPDRDKSCIMVAQRAFAIGGQSDETLDTILAR